MRIHVFQPLKLRDPFRQGQAVNGWHVDGPVQPIVGLAKLKIEIADALRAVGQFERPKETAQSVLAADFKTIELEIE